MRRRKPYHHGNLRETLLEAAIHYSRTHDANLHLFKPSPTP
jgi:hypothetical protein